MARRRRAIVLEDDDGIRGLLVSVLKTRGYDVLPYSSPADCPLTQLHECCCRTGETCADLIVSDVNMPFVSGLEFVQAQKEKGCRVRNIAFMSAAWTDAGLQLAAELGCKTFEKPVHLADIETWLDECEKDVSPDTALADWFIRK